MFVCVYLSVLFKTEDAEIKTVFAHALDLSQQPIQVITKRFKEKDYAIPLGFTESEVNVDAPRLFPMCYCWFKFVRMTADGIGNDGSALTASPRRDIAAE